MNFWRRVLYKGLTNQGKYARGGERRENVDNRIPEELVEEIRLRSDIVETISEYVSLQRKGKNYLGLCPFHSEDTPSFTVTPEKQMFYCFGCHAGGNVFSFLMKKENWTFLETVRHLAQKHGITLPEKELSPRERQEQTRRRRWEEIHEWSAGYFHDILLNRPEGEPGRIYLAKRGIDEETIKMFRLGYAPDRWDGLIEAMQRRGVKPQELVEAGLALERDSHEGKGHYRFYDRFRKRVIFTILDSRQRPVAFGGRVLDDSLPKYLNSPETAFFSKGQHLYGMHRAYQGIREQGFALLAEGYMDVIALQKAGFNNAVASLGTALTRDQAKLLRRYTQRVVIVYDSDSAGVQASLRAGEILRDAGFRVEVLSLSGAKDPDEYLKVHGVEEFRKLLDKALTYIEFKYHILVKEHLPQSAPEKRELVIKLAPDIKKVQSPVEREVYERFLSLELGLTLEAIQREIASIDRNLAKNRQENEYSQHEQDISVKNRDNISRCVNSLSLSVPDGIYRAERIILRLILENPTLLTRVEQELGSDFWLVPEHRQISQLIKEAETTNVLVLQPDWEEAVQSQLAHLLVEEIELSQAERLLEDCIRQIRSQRAEQTIEELQARMVALEKSGDMAGAMALLKEIGERLRSGEK